MGTRLRLNEIFDQFLEGIGFFEYLPDPIPWAEESSFDHTVLNLKYFGGHSGMKYASPLVMALLTSTNPPTFRSGALESLGKIAETFYYQNWKRLYDTYIVKYNMLDSYNISVNGTRNDEETDTTTYGKSVSGTDATTHGHAVTDTSTTSDTREYGDVTNGTDSTYGFNSTTAVPTASHTNSNSGNETTDTTVSATTTNSGTDSTTKSETFSGTDKTSNTREETFSEERTGNFGHNTRQTLIAQERALWFEPYLDAVFRDIDKILALQVY